MTYRELLELAAKAAGEITHDWYGNHAYFDGVLKRWNPLTDDGDALRLAVHLGLRVECRLDGQVYVWKNDVLIWNEFALHENVANERNAATRRAIVRAAAEIGKELQ